MAAGPPIQRVRHHAFSRRLAVDLTTNRFHYELNGSEFDDAAFAEFRRRLDEETRLLGEWLAQGRPRSAERRIGFEIEAWLIDGDARPAAQNQEFLAAVDDLYVVPELARFNFEINSDPLPVAPGAFDAMHDALLARWQNCQDSAAGIGLRPLLIGILPTVRSGDLELYLMDPDGGNVEQLTDSPGYDGGAFFSRDSQQIVWRASRPTAPTRSVSKEPRTSKRQPVELGKGLTSVTSARPRRVKKIVKG